MQGFNYFFRNFDVSQCEGAASAGASAGQENLQLSEGTERPGAWVENSPTRAVVPCCLSKDSGAGLVTVTRVSGESSEEVLREGAELRPGRAVKSVGWGHQGAWTVTGIPVGWLGQGPRT